MNVLTTETLTPYLVSERLEKSELRVWGVRAKSVEHAQALVRAGKASLVGLYTQNTKNVYRQDYRL